MPRPASSPPPPPPPPPPPIITPTTAIIGPPIPVTSRVAQLDAAVLDTSILTLLKPDLSTTLTLPYPDETTALLRFLLYFFAVRRRATPGLELNNLKFANDDGSSRCKRWIYLLVVSFGPYLWDKIEQGSLTSTSTTTTTTTARWARVRDKLWPWALRVYNVFKFAEFVNLLLFLRYGIHRNLLERLLNQSITYSTPSSSSPTTTTSSPINIAFFNHQLLTHGLSSFLSFLLPYITPPIHDLYRTILPPPPPPPGHCPVCKGTLRETLSYVMECGCGYCYVCWKVAKRGRRGFGCWGCGKRVRSGKRAVEVVE